MESYAAIDAVQRLQDAATNFSMNLLREAATAVSAAPRASSRINGRAHHAVAASVACGLFWIK